MRILAGALTLFAACDWGTENKQSVAADSNTEAARHEYVDDEYTFYFKNGNAVRWDTNGYDLDKYGSTTVYNYLNKNVKNLNNALNNAQVPHEMYTTRGGSPYDGWNRFSTSELCGVGWEPVGDNSYPDILYILTAEGKKLTVENQYYAIYLPANTPYNNLDKAKSYYHLDELRAALDIHKGRNKPALILGYCGERAKGTAMFTNVGLNVAYVGKYTVMLDASNIALFSYNQLGWLYHKINW